MAFSHVASSRQFRLKLNGVYASIEYVIENNVYDLIETTVPEEYRGKKIGEKVAEKTFDYLLKKKQRFRITCQYLQNFYERNKAIYKSDLVEVN